MTREEIIKGLDEELAARTKATSSNSIDYTFEEFWEDTYGNSPSIWNSSLEMYNKAKEDYKRCLQALQQEGR